MRAPRPSIVRALQEPAPMGAHSARMLRPGRGLRPAASGRNLRLPDEIFAELKACGWSVPALPTRPVAPERRTGRKNKNRNRNRNRNRKALPQLHTSESLRRIGVELSALQAPRRREVLASIEASAVAMRDRAERRPEEAAEEVRPASPPPSGGGKQGPRAARLTESMRRKARKRHVSADEAREQERQRRVAAKRQRQRERLDAAAAQQRDRRRSSALVDMRRQQRALAGAKRRVPRDVQEAFLRYAGSVTGDGAHLNRAEFVEACSDVLRARHGDRAVRRGFVSFDAHRRGRLTLDDFAAGVENVRAPGNDAIKTRFVFDMYDVDRSGSIVLAELAGRLDARKDKREREFASLLLAALDDSGDEALQYEELHRACMGAPTLFSCLALGFPIALDCAKREPPGFSWRSVMDLWGNVRRAAGRDADGLGSHESGAGDAMTARALVDALGLRPLLEADERAAFRTLLRGVSAIFHGSTREQTRIVFSVVAAQLGVDDGGGSGGSGGGYVQLPQLRALLEGRIAHLEASFQHERANLERVAQRLLELLGEHAVKGVVGREVFIGTVERNADVLRGLRRALLHW